MEIKADFECGNIIVGDMTDDEVQLSIRPDTNAGYYQWLHFTVTGDGAPTFKIMNASDASYPQAWNGYDVLASHDGTNWHRVPTQYDGQHLTFEHQAGHEQTTYTFFVPYYEKQREALLEFCDGSALAKVAVLGQSVNGKPLHKITIGTDDADHKRVWIVSRQHAGEPMAEWATDGLVRYLLDEDNATAQALLEQVVFYIVPNMNPDGSYAGNLRANANGVDLNRAWDKPSDQCPEIVLVRDAIAETGVDYFLDIHGDEERPFIWLIGPQVDVSEDLAGDVTRYEALLSEISLQIQPPPQSIVGVKPKDHGMSVDYIAATYGAPGWIIELPFKAVPDHDGNADSLLAEGCMQFGRQCMDALYKLLNR